MKMHRRDLLKSAAAVAAASTLPDWFLKESAAAAPQPSAGSVDRPGIALIG